MRSWEQFASDVGEIARIPAERVRPDATLIGDLGLDSLALTEVVAMLVVDYGVDAISDGLDGTAWERVTAGELFAAYSQR